MPPIDHKQISAKKHEWRNWSKADWNIALFKHFFLDSNGEDRPVYRIPVSPDELAQIVQEPDVNVQEVQEGFLKTVRTKTHIEFNNELSKYDLDPKVGWQGQEIPPFFIILAFSCLVANPPDEAIRKDGDFRRRLAVLMKHNNPPPHYPLAELAELWKAFSLWLDARRNEGCPYLRLELPNPGNEVRIGYSLKLAFPSRKDRAILVSLLTDQGFMSEPPIPNVIKSVGKEATRFSENFRMAYDEFCRAFAGEERELEKYPFWGAVRDVIASIQDEQSKEVPDQHSLQLVCEPGSFVLLLSTLHTTFPGSELEFSKADTPYGEFSNVLCDGVVSESGFLKAAEGLLNGRYRETIIGKGWPAIDIAIKQGVLLFTKTENLTWSLTFVRHDEGQVKGLIRHSLKQLFLDAFPPDKCPGTKESQYYDWIEVEEFPAIWLLSMTYAENSHLSTIRCLQSTVSGSPLRLVGGCPVNGGFLGFSHFLPAVRSPSCETVNVIPDDANSSAKSITLNRVDSDLFDFCFPTDIQPLSGPYRIVCHRDGRVLAQKKTTFYSEIHVNEYLQPTDPMAWKVEAGGPDMVAYGDASKQLAEFDRGDEEIPAVVKAPTTVLSNHRTLFSRILDSRDHDFSYTSLEYNVWETSEFAEAIHFMEICGSMAMQRRGIAESELIEILSRCLNVGQYQPKWDILRAWIEGGYFERLNYQRWRRTDYYARTPRFSLETAVDGSIRGTLLGLSTFAYRNRADIELSKRGCVRAQGSSLSTWVIPPPAWIAPTMTPFIDVSKLLGLAIPSWSEPIAQTLWSMTNIVADRNKPPQFFELSGCWDWDRSWFSRKGIPSQVGVEVLRFHRPDRSSYYQVTVDGESIWWSISRNWALLLAHELAGSPVFALKDSNQVVRISKGQIYLPLPVGRYLTGVGPTLPGPVGDTNYYSYTFRSTEERTHFLAAIFGDQKLGTETLRRWAQWMLDLSRRPLLEPSTVCVPIPSDLRQALIRFKHVPEICELLQTRLAPYLLSRVRRGISRFSELVED